MSILTRDANSLGFRHIFLLLLSKSVWGKLDVQNMLKQATANMSTWWQIAKKVVNIVKEEVEVAKICKQIVENGQQLGIVVA